MFGFLDYERSVARPGFNRWLVPPAALAVHLSIGQAYAFTVFKIPLTRALGITTSLPGRDWTQSQVAWIFSIAIAFLGISAALFGKWLERAGPRKAMFVSAICFSSGFFISALGIHLHQMGVSGFHISFSFFNIIPARVVYIDSPLWLLYLGYGAIGGIGLGLGYIAPVSTLIRWFIDRPGMATGLAIMGFGGGAMIGGPLAVDLRSFFKTSTNTGVVQTMLVMGCLYGCFILFGAFLVRVPPEGWKPAGYVAKKRQIKMISSRNIDATIAIRTPQFWLLWVVLCANVTAGIGILEQASPMIQEMFKGHVTEAAAGGFVGLLSLFNMGGRFVWSSTSDHIGRKATYMVFFVAGAILYAFLPHTGEAGLGSLPLFVFTSVLILSMYGGGFATIPAYLRDLFGPANVSSIHGRLLTAWSVAGVLGPVLVNYLRQYQIDRHVPPTQAYAFVLYTMVGLLLVGLIANSLVRPVSEHFHDEAADSELLNATSRSQE